MNLTGRQTIYCTVASCRNNSRNHRCLLDCIQVSPLAGTADSSEESMCDSFERKDE